MSTETTSSDEAAWAEMWERKADGREMFAQATLTRDVQVGDLIGNAYDRASVPSGMKAGDRVLITVVSRLGDVAIRSTRIDVEEHGYSARVEPKALRDLRFLSNGGRPWRREMEEKFAAKAGAR